MVVEIDETLFSRRKNHAGRVYPQQRGFDSIYRQTDEYFIVKVQNRSTQALLHVINDNVNDGSILHSDSCRAYQTDELEKAEFRY